jgi:type IV pilus assembly protein PilB
VINILPILQSKGIITEKDVASIAGEAQEMNKNVEDVLHDRGVSDQDVLIAKSEQWDIPTRLLSDTDVTFEVLKYIPEESAKHYHVVPLGLADGVLEVGIVDPDNIDALDALNFISAKAGLPFKVFLITERDYQHVIEMYGGLTSEVGQALNALRSEEDATADNAPANILSDERVTQNLDDLESTVQEAGKKAQGDFREEAPVTKIVATILRSAIDARASDIHVEPEYEKTRVRFRVDGLLSQSLVLPAKVQRAVIARIKILAGIKLDERRKPQDGRFSATINSRRVDFRVSTFPVYYGEKAVLRILDSERSNITLEDLGMDTRQLDTVKRAVKAPYGMILITGPTGSGKSTTLYSMLNEVDKDGLNVLSLEDPVEYNISGVSQSQVRPEIGYTFASGIRSVLRQDPDIIMVGEIRDKETAQLAVQAALTGHLVLSTLHTNNAAGAVPRLVDMGVDPYLLSPTLNLVIAQRLVRRICPDSGRKVAVEGPIQKLIDDQFADLPKEYHKIIPKSDEVLYIKPSSNCPTGTRGRIGVYEMLEVTDDVRRTVLTSGEEDAVYEVARKAGMTTLMEDTIIKALQKLIPFEEVAHVGGALRLDEEHGVEEGESKEAAPESDTADAASDIAPPKQDLV